MKLSINYEELMPTTVSGHAIKITYVYSSFDKEEVDKLKERLADEIGTGIVATIKVEDKE